MSLEIKNYDISRTNMLKIWCEAKLASIAPFIPEGKIRKRSFHGYCIGLPRSGTHSLSYMFKENYKSRHEPRAHNMIFHLLNYINGNYSLGKFRRILSYHDDRVYCDMESAHYLHFVAGQLADLFPEARFILTVRDPISWLNSEINQNLSTNNYPVWKVLEDYRYSQYDMRFTKEDEYLSTLPSTYPVASYLTYWSDHIIKVINSVPEERLLVLKTNEISSSVETISDFLLLSPGTIKASHAHAAKDKDFNIYESIEAGYVIKESEKYCGNTVNILKDRYGISF